MNLCMISPCARFGWDLGPVSNYIHPQDGLDPERILLNFACSQIKQTPPDLLLTKLTDKAPAKGSTSRAETLRV